MTQLVHAQTSKLDAALAYVRLGLYALPVWWPIDGVCACPAGPDCGRSAAKHPLTKHGLLDATLDERQIRSWWRRWPDANIGIALARSGLVAFDVDTAEAHRAFAEIEAAHGRMRPRQLSGSGNGNLHAFAKAPPRAIRGALDGITLRWRNYVVAAPSRHVKGGLYAWEPGCAPWDVRPTVLTTVLAERMRRREAPRAQPHTTPQVSDDVRIKRARAYLAKIPPAIQGHRGSDALFRAICWVMHGFGLDDDATRSIIVDHYNPRCEPPWSDREIDHKIADARDKVSDPSRWRVNDVNLTSRAEPSPIDMRGDQ
jgi:putative DNA primase/helicase